MRNIAPQILRQRLLIEARYEAEVNKKIIKDYFQNLAAILHLRTYGEPIIYSPTGTGKEVNQGFDAFIPLVDSGIALYVWTNEKFLSCVIYSCKKFKVEDALDFTKDYFKTTELVYREF